MARSLAPVMYWAIRTTLCSALRSGGDATGLDAPDGAAVDIFEDLGTHAKSFQSPEGEKVVCPLHDCLGDVDTKALETLHPLHYSPGNVNGGLFGPARLFL